MRQIVSTAVVAVIVGALAGATMSAVAQAPAEQAITPAAGINAASVDGKSAVGYTNKKNARKNKLVATNKRGELPPNIVRPFWGYVKNKPGILADDQISWNEVVGTPAGFADGVDNQGVTGVRVVTVTAPSSLSLSAGTGDAQTVDCPAGFLAVGGGFDWLGSSGGGFSVWESAALDADTWRIYVQAASDGGGSVKAQVTCMRAEPGGLTIAANRSVFSSGK